MRQTQHKNKMIELTREILKMNGVGRLKLSNYSSLELILKKNLYESIPAVTIYRHISKL